MKPAPVQNSPHSLDDSPKGVFLTADWRNVLLLNFEIDSGVLRPFVPPGTELATIDSRTFVSLVGFQFLRTRMLGSIPVPFHRDFEEINLRFYVRRRTANEWRRGVVFIKELVPKRAVALVARLVYNENYHAVPMGRDIETLDTGARFVKYSWRSPGKMNDMSATVIGSNREIVDGSNDEFLANHEWGYGRDHRGHSMEYRVAHGHWRLWDIAGGMVQCDTANVYGPQFSEALSAAPYSGMFADGSDVTVYRGVRISS